MANDKDNLFTITDSEHLTIGWPEYNCPIHGKVKETMVVYIGEKKTVFCLRCYEDDLRRRLPVLDEKDA